MLERDWDTTFMLLKSSSLTTVKLVTTVVISGRSHS